MYIKNKKFASIETSKLHLCPPLYPAPCTENLTPPLNSLALKFMPPPHLHCPLPWHLIMITPLFQNTLLSNLLPFIYIVWTKQIVQNHVCRAMWQCVEYQPVKVAVDSALGLRMLHDKRWVIKDSEVVLQLSLTTKVLWMYQSKEHNISWRHVIDITWNKYGEDELCTLSENIAHSTVHRLQSSCQWALSCLYIFWLIDWLNILLTVRCYNKTKLINLSLYY